MAEYARFKSEDILESAARVRRLGCSSSFESVARRVYCSQQAQGNTLGTLRTPYKAPTMLHSQ